MSVSVIKTTFKADIDPYDEGPHTMYSVYYHVSDYQKFIIRTKAGRFFELFGGCDEVVDAVFRVTGDGPEVTGPERSALMKFLDQAPPIGSAHGTWISVEERLPENDTEVLVHSKEFGICDMVHTFLTQPHPRWIPSGMSVHTKDVTHWMKLPEPPSNNPDTQ